MQKEIVNILLGQSVGKNMTFAYLDDCSGIYEVVQKNFNRGRWCRTVRYASYVSFDILS